MMVSTVTMALSLSSVCVCDETDTGDIPVYNEYIIPDRRRPVKVLPDVNTQVVKSDSQWNSRDCCFGMCNKADSVDRSGICLCWDFLCWLVWGYRVSCLAAIVINDQSHGIDLYSDERRVCASGLGLVGGPMTPGDNVYTATLGEDKDTDRHDELTGLTRCGVYSSTNRQREIADRLVTEWAMTRCRMQSDFPCHEHSGLVDRQADGLVVAREDKDKVSGSRIPLCRYREQDTGFWRVGSATTLWNSWWTRDLR